MYKSFDIGSLLGSVNSENNELNLEQGAVFKRNKQTQKISKIDMDIFKTNPKFRWFLERKNFFSKEECQEIIDLVDTEAELRSGYHRGTENRDILEEDDKNSCISKLHSCIKLVKNKVIPKSMNIATPLFSGKLIISKK